MKNEALLAFSSMLVVIFLVLFWHGLLLKALIADVRAIDRVICAEEVGCPR